MTNRYRVILPLEVHLPAEEGGDVFKQGDEFEKEFSVEDEAANLASGLLEIVPCEWKVIGGSEVFETKPGDTFEAAMPLGQQELLIAGGHIKRVVAKPKPKAKADGKSHKSKE